MLEVISPAEADLDSAADWYKRIRPGLRDDFLLCVDEAIAIILRQPLAYQKVRGDIRRILIRRFPYGIFFRISEKQIKVIAVLHNRRSPFFLEKRM